MFTFSVKQMDRIAQQAFYARLVLFITERALSEALRAAVRDVAATHALWDRHWDEARHLTEHDAALRLTFVLAWHADGGNVKEALLHLAHKQDPELLVKRVLSEKGHLRFSDFDHPLKAPGGR